MFNSIQQSTIIEETKKLKKLPLTPKQEEDLLTHQLTKLIEKYKALDKEYESLTEEIKTTEEYLNKLKNENILLEKEIKEYKSNFDKNNDSDITKMISDLEKYHQLKNTKTENKKLYKTEIIKLEQKLEIATTKTNDEEESVKLQNLLSTTKEEYNHQKLRVEQLEAALANRNRRIITLSLKIDDNLTSGEILQFQKRFIELYKQVSLITSETEYFYNLFNSLTDIIVMLRKEKNIFDSILSKFPIAKANPLGQIEFRKSLENILKGAISSYEQMNNEYSLVLENYKFLTNKYQSLVAKQYKYRKLATSLNQKLSEIT